MPQASQQTGAEQVSRGGTKQVSVGGTKLGGADQVNKATEIPTISPTARKRGSSRSEMSGSKVHAYNLMHNGVTEQEVANDRDAMSVPIYVSIIHFPVYS